MIISAKLLPKAISEVCAKNVLSQGSALYPSPIGDSQCSPDSCCWLETGKVAGVGAKVKIKGVPQSF